MVRQSLMVFEALKFAESKHSGQVRKVSGDPYITHPIKVAFLLSSYKKSKKLDHLIAAAILHDTKEDTETTYEELLSVFGPLVTSLVFELTSIDEELKAAGGKVSYLKKKMVGMSSYALTIKLVDRLANLLDSPTDKTKVDTIEILDYLEANRKLTGTQKSIVADIRALIS